MAYTLLDAAYEMYYPEAEFGIGDTLGRLKSRAQKKIKRAGKSLRAKKGALGWNLSGGKFISASPEHRSLLRSKEFMTRITRPAYGRRLGKKR